MPHYAVRITHSYEVAKPIVHLWAMKCEKLLAYEHLGERTGKIHIHLLLVNTSVDKKQLRNIAATTKVPVSGNEWMSFKVADLEPTYITYMSKGEIDPCYNKGFEAWQLDDYKQKWVKPNSALKKTEDDKVIEGWIYYYEHELCVEQPETFTLTQSPVFFDLRREIKLYIWNNHVKGVYPKWNHDAKRKYKMLMDTQIYKSQTKIPDAREPQYDMWKW